MTVDPTSTPLVSVVIPAHNPGAFLVDALRSVIAQDYPAWECAVVDDGSVEDLSWVDVLDHRIRRIRRVNRGPAAARNAGIADTTGTYVAFLDSDDVWTTDKLSRQVAAMQSDPEAVLCHTAADIIDSNGRVIEGWPYARPIGGYMDLLRGNGVGVSSALVRRDAMIEAGCWNILRRTAEDLDLWLRMSWLGGFIYIQDVLVLYRRHDANASSDAGLMAAGVASVLRDHEAVARRSGDTAAQRGIRAARVAARRGWGATAFHQAGQGLVHRDLGLFARRLTESLRLSPRYTLRSTLRYLVRAFRSR